ncbi:MAG: FtsX-like permease family protein [Pseudomonadota bacterium]|nr:FtsX-like permease family protein [Pseudomonadota bacterium]
MITRLAAALWPLHRRAGLRPLRRHPGLAALAVLGIALGVAVVLAVALVGASARTALTRSLDSVLGPATHQVLGPPGGMPQSLYADLRLSFPVPMAPVIDALVTPVRAPGRSLRLLGVEPVAELALRGARLSGESTDPLAGARFLTAPAQVLVPAALADALTAGPDAGGPLRPGDTLALRLPDRVVEVEVAGVLPAQARGPPLAGLLFMDIAGAQRLLDLGDRISRIDLRLPSGAAGATLAEAIAATLPPGVRLETTGARTRALQGLTEAFEFNLRAMSLLALVVGLYLIYNTMGFTVVQRRPLFGTLRLLGVTGGQLFRTLLLEAALLGLVGTLVGLGLGVLLAQGLLGLVARTIDALYYPLPLAQLTLDLPTLAATAALGIGGAVAAAMLPAREAARTPPRQTLDRAALEARLRRRLPWLAALGVPVALLAVPLLAWPGTSLLPAYGALVALVLAMSLWVPWLSWHASRGLARLLPVNRLPALRLAVRGVGASLSRTGLATAALTLALATAMGVAIMIHSFRLSVETWLTQTLSADFYVSPGTAAPRGAYVDEAVAEALAARAEVAAVVGIRNVRLPGPGGEVNVTGITLAPPVRDSFALLAGQADAAFAALADSARRPPAALASEPLALRRDLAPGDTVVVTGRAGPQTLEVVGIYRDYGSDQGRLLVAAPVLAALAAAPGYNGIGVYVRPAASTASVLAAARALATPERPLAVQPTRDILQFSLQVFDQTFAVTAVLRVLTLVISLVGIVGALMALQLERLRELATLRALGMTPAQIGGTVTLQTVLLGLLAGGFALPTGLALAAVLTGEINRRAFGWTIAFALPAPVLLQTLLLALLAALVAAVLPAWRAARIRPALALRSE